MTTLNGLLARGFDASHKSGNGYNSVRCSACEAMVLNGHPTHERGCPNEMHECLGCNEMLSARQGRYCEDCSS